MGYFAPPGVDSTGIQDGVLSPAASGLADLVFRFEEPPSFSPPVVV